MRYSSRFSAFAHILPAQAKIDSNFVTSELRAASRSINEGHVKQGCDRLAALLRQIDPNLDKDDYWRTSATLVEYLTDIEDHPSFFQFSRISEIAADIELHRLSISGLRLGYFFVAMIALDN